MKEMMPNAPKASQMESLPKALAEQYVARTWLENAEKVQDGDKSKIYRIFERQTMIPGIGDGKLRVDARHWHHPDATLHRDQVRFEYVVPSEKGDRLVAEMHLNELDEDAFWLQHRYVQPEFRGRKGIGSALLQQAEDWLRQVGEVQGHDMRLGLLAGQIDVFRWLQKQKFWIRKREKQKLDEILQYPERFDIECATDDPKITQDLYVFEKGKEARAYSDSVRLRFEKRIATGFPSPETDAIMKHFVPSWDEKPVETAPEKELISVREATQDDAAAIARIQHESWLATYPNDAAEISKQDLEHHLEDVESRTQRWKGRLGPKEKGTDDILATFVLNVGDRVAGFCRVVRGKHYGHVDALYLDPAYTEKGIGGMIFQRALAWLGNDEPIDLEVASYNDRAIRFYERYGFRKQGDAKPQPLKNGKSIPLTLMVRDRGEEA